MITNRLRDPMRIVDWLPAAAQTLLRGKERTYSNVALLLKRESRPYWSPAECFELSAAETRALGAAFIDAGFQNYPGDTGGDPGPPEGCGSSGMLYRPIPGNASFDWTICPGVVSLGDQPAGFWVPVDGVGIPVEIVGMNVAPILPHGEFAVWLG
jgi:hypothetical protein